MDDIVLPLRDVLKLSIAELETDRLACLRVLDEVPASDRSHRLANVHLRIIQRVLAELPRRKEQLRLMVESFNELLDDICHDVVRSQLSSFFEEEFLDRVVPFSASFLALERLRNSLKQYPSTTLDDIERAIVVIEEARQKFETAVNQITKSN